ncbi:unnamed protein product [Adineta ricciae]|uniref:G-protein coupled receptors family 1 profile domain-containing protein n=1 Tax=Adineta ricciae TaxID=249248 RepID=A0A814BKW2_ADIRI|nr:unnamed protein product [Adineta ricciae]CAF1311929.1 unnamed protein product [Adineta ricciae]
MYLSIILSCVLLLKEYIRILPGHLFSLDTLDDGILCQIRAYFLWTSNCTIYYSIMLQSLYRLCRILYHTKQRFLSLRFYELLILLQWIFCFLIMIPGLFLGDYIYSQGDYLCQIDYTKWKNIILNGILAYYIPINVTIGCYFYTLRKIKQDRHSTVFTVARIQQVTARRDLIVISRLCVLFGLLTMISIPAVTGYFIYVFTGYLPWWLSSLQWLVFSLIMNIVTIVLVFISPQVRILFTCH